MLKVNFGTAESKLMKHIGTDHSICAQRGSYLAKQQNLLPVMRQFPFSIREIPFRHFPDSQHRSTPNASSMQFEI